MKYTQRSFTVAVSDSDGAYCTEKGKHSAHDSHGRCLCCGEKVAPTMLETVEAFAARRGGTTTLVPNDPLFTRPGFKIISSTEPAMS